MRAPPFLRLVAIVAGTVASVALASIARAQTGTVAGTVRDAATRQPIEGALIRVGGTSYGAFTRTNGTFTVLGVPPGVYTITARRVGFATVELTNVSVQIARTRTVAFALRRAAGDTTERVAALEQVGDSRPAQSALTLLAEQITLMPTLNVSGAIGVGGAYLDLPATGMTISANDRNREVRSVASIRGARPEATLYLLDGIDVSNPVFGSPPMFIEPFTAAGVTVSPAHADAEDGPAVGGLVSQLIRSGGRAMHGSLEYQTASIPARLGAAASGESKASSARGYLSGPAPFIGDKIQFMVGGHWNAERPDVIAPLNGDWRGFGDLQHQQMVGKLSWAAARSTSVTMSGVRQHRAVVSSEWQRIGADTIALPTVRDDSRYLNVRLEQRFKRATLTFIGAHLSGDRLTCSIWQGVCIADRLNRQPVGQEIPAFGPPPPEHPYGASGTYYGGERYASNVLRADVIAQPGDHHELRAGIYSTHHDIDYNDVSSYAYLQGKILTSQDVYRARPVEFSSYVQDAMQFDLITVHLGLRFDWANSGGFMFANRADPTNGTTAREVCDGKAPGMSDRPFTYGEYSGIVACLNSPIGETGRPILLDSATFLAQGDDFIRVRPRAAFAPRMALSFPLSETSGFFLDIGRYARNPLYHDVFRNTGTGTRAGKGPGTDNVCNARIVHAGTDECLPNFTRDERIPDFIGNPGLMFEMSDGFEVGFTMRTGKLHTLDASFYSNTQAYLPKLYLLTVETDIGRTYGVFGAPARNVSNGGSSTALGFSVTLRRQRLGALAYSVNYTRQQGREIGSNPDLLAEALATNTPAFDGEQPTTRGHSDALNAVASLQWSDRTPKALGRTGRLLLGRSRTVLTFFAASKSGSDFRCGAFGSPCPAAFNKILPGTGNTANLLYMRTLNQSGAQWAVVLRIRNLLDVDDGSGSAFGTMVSRRRILAGTNVTF